MARIMIQLLCDVETQHREIFVDYFSEEDATASEHEKGHRQLVDQLLDHGTFRQAETNQVIVNRDPLMMPVILSGG